MLLGDGAAGFSLMDADSLVRHGLPVVMVVGNNGIWGLEKHPMQAIYGWDVACDLQPGCRYDEVVTALGGAGELVTDPDEIGPALDRALRQRRALPRQRRHRPDRRLPPQLQPRLIHPSTWRRASTPGRPGPRRVLRRRRVTRMDGRQDGETVSASVHSPRRTRTTSWPFLSVASTAQP